MRHCNSVIRISFETMMNNFIIIFISVSIFVLIIGHLYHYFFHLFIQKDNKHNP